MDLESVILETPWGQSLLCSVNELLGEPYHHGNSLGEIDFLHCSCDLGVSTVPPPITTVRRWFSFPWLPSCDQKTFFGGVLGTPKWPRFGDEPNGP